MHETCFLKHILSSDTRVKMIPREKARASEHWKLQLGSYYTETRVIISLFFSFCKGHLLHPFQGCQLQMCHFESD